MADAIEIIKLLVPLILEIIQLLKGQPSDVKKEAINKGLDAMHAHCDGVGCPSEPVK